MSHLTITLDGDELKNGGIEAGKFGWWADDNLITVRSAARTASYRLPRRRPKVVLERYGDGEGALIIGGFNSTLVTVRGRRVALEKIRKAVL